MGYPIMVGVWPRELELMLRPEVGGVGRGRTGPRKVQAEGTVRAKAPGPEEAWEV